MEAAYLEIYNEALRDLLTPGAAHSAAHTIVHQGGVTQVAKGRETLEQLHQVHSEEIAAGMRL